MTKKQLLIIILGLVVFSSFGYFFISSEKKIRNYPPKNQKIVAFGDSLIQGVGATPKNDFISLVGRDLGVNIINKGVSGDTTVSALERIQEILTLDPGIVIVLLGGNDVLRRIPKAETFENLEKIVENLQNNGAVVILLGVRGGILVDGYEENYEEISEKYETAYVSNVLKDLITNKKYMSDGIHPNDLGYAIIAERVTPVLENILKGFK
jgi:lysophospholipase L1-like esterase